MLYRTFLVSLVLLAAFLGGCYEQDVPDDSAIRFVDIPVPIGFELLDSSYTVEAETIRTGTISYEGSGYPLHVERFYKKVMPELAWELYKTDAPTSDTRYLFFRKDNEICVVHIFKKMRNTYIDIELR
ncbi:MAG: hypothetical protein U5N86_02345 [Planctomycetota bacterium]|nr:hypothetical protein [Planctomycetota bacterium]